LKGCELELIQKVEKIGYDREPRPKLKIVGANSYKASWGIGCMAILNRDVHLIVRWEMKLSSASHHLMELGFRREALKNLSSLTPFSDLHRSRAHSLSIFSLHHKTIFKVRGIVLFYDVFAMLLTRVLLNSIGYL